MLSGYPPFQSKTQEEIYEKVRNLAYVWPKNPDHGNYIPDEAKDLVGSCLNLSEEERPEPDDFVEHPFFNMYDGCIPQQLDPLSRTTKPTWLLANEPRGDCMDFGHGLDYDQKLMCYADHSETPSLRYRLCKNAFYALCGVGRKSDGSARRPAGKSWSKSTYAECLLEDEAGLQPVIPLPEGSIYKYPHGVDGDWAAPESISSGTKSEATTKNNRNFSIRSNAASATRTKAALAAAQQRRRESQSHAATLRQQAASVSGSARKANHCAQDPNAPAVPALPDRNDNIKLNDEQASPIKGLSERPIRARHEAPSAQNGAMRGNDEHVAPLTSHPYNPPKVLSVGRTRSQSRRLEAASSEPRTGAHDNENVVSTAQSKTRRPYNVPSSEDEVGDAPKAKEQRRPNPSEVQRNPVKSHGKREEHQEIPNTKASTTQGKPYSTLGSSPLFHSEDKSEILPETSLNEINTNLRIMLSNLISQPAPRRHGATRQTRHPYVIKWVDYTNRYGIGYVLDDGSVGCVFRAENGQPASGVIVRDGERHFRRKARALEKREGESASYFYPDAEQFVPQNGGTVEFYENVGADLPEYFGIRRALVPSSVFEIKSSHAPSSGPGIKVRTNAGIECARSDAEKVKRVKLVDQFGKYMIRSLGRHSSSDEGVARVENSGQYIKFYQRLGNVGVWGFGDGAFQVR